MNLMQFEIEKESKNPDCKPKITQALVDGMFKCFGSELVLGILTILAIALLI